jgi:hypothetical protein
MNTEIYKFIPVAILLFLTPGFAFLGLTRLWRGWPALQRWIVAIGISIAFYPVFFYLTRALFPNLHLGARKLWVLLILFGIITVIYFWKERKTLFHLEALEWVAVGVILVTLATRFWIIADQPFPAWSDALHHVLITQLTAQNGQLPFTLEPYAPTPLDMYHLGLYSLTGPVEILTGLPAYSAFLWISQLLNGLCGLGVYLFLDRKIGRKGAIIGLVAIGLWSFQPAWYVNWSRTTSLAADTILLISALLTWETLIGFGDPELGRGAKIAMLAVGGLFNAGIFMFHFRVAAYYLPLLIIICLVSLFRNIRQKRMATLTAMSLIAMVSIVLILPVLIKAVPVYVDLKSLPSVSGSDFEYYRMPIQAFFDLGVQKWLFILCCLMILAGLVLRGRTMLLILAWVIFLVLEAYIYNVGVPILMFTSVSGVAVMLYLPITLLIGLGAGELLNFMDKSSLARIVNPLLIICLLSGIGLINQRVNGLEPYRFFLNEDDIQAMSWIRSNTPEDAVFAINTYMWMGKSPHGIDGGYWIPFFTGRETTASTMLFSLSPPDYVNQILERSADVKLVEGDPEQVTNLCQAGVDYIYLGNNPGVSQGYLDPDKLLAVDGVTRVYQYNNNIILQICIP